MTKSFGEYVKAESFEKYVIDGVYTGPKLLRSSVSCYSSDIRSLGNLEEVQGSVRLIHCHNLKSLGKLRKAYWQVVISHCANLESLGDLRTIRGTLNMTDLPRLLSSGKLEEVQGDLNINQVPFKNLGSLRIIGNKCSIPEGVLPPACRLSYRLKIYTDRESYQAPSEYKAILASIKAASLSELLTMRINIHKYFKPFIDVKLKGGDPWK